MLSDKLGLHVGHKKHAKCIFNGIIFLLFFFMFHKAYIYHKIIRILLKVAVNSFLTLKFSKYEGVILTLVCLKKLKYKLFMDLYSSECTR